jgi:hypothetical protein
VVIQFAIAAAATDRVPSFNVEPACRAAAERARPAGDAQACIRLEQGARDELVRRWREFARTDKQHCIEVVTMAGHAPTYTELLTCLELAHEARKLRH